MNDFLSLLEEQFPRDAYLTGWYSHRERLHDLPEEPPQAWAPRAVKSIGRWMEELPDPQEALSRQEGRLEQLFTQFYTEDPRNHGPEDFPEPYPLQDFPLRLLSFLTEVYPEHRTPWAFLCTNVSLGHRGRVTQLWSLWNQVKAERKRRLRTQNLAQGLPDFHRSLIIRLRKLLDAEKTLQSIFSQADVGWDLDRGDWEELDLRPLVQAAETLSSEKEIQRIAELLGRDYRARTRPPVNPPPLPPTRREPGKTEIQGITLGRNPVDTLSQELSLLASKLTENLFFQRMAEGRLLNWEYTQPSDAPINDLQKSQDHQAKNERGPMILVLDTSGSMRGKPEEVAKTTVLALVKIALEENRRCFLINFSSQIRTLEVSDLQNHLREFLEFLAFSFHGGTDLPPALREAIKTLDQNAYQEADVLVLSDFAVPKVPGPLRNLVRRHQEERGSRFYALTISARPLNDILNIFDAAWTYNIHHNQKPGIDPADIFPL